MLAVSNGQKQVGGSLNRSLNAHPIFGAQKRNDTSNQEGMGASGVDNLPKKSKFVKKKVDH
jgi:hypothetical protein